MQGIRLLGGGMSFFPQISLEGTFIRGGTFIRNAIVQSGSGVVSANDN